MPVDVCRRTHEDAQRYAIRFERRLAAWEVGSPDLRIIQIGGELKMTTAAKFREKFPEAIEWLATQGCTEAEAMRRFEASLTAESKNPFWRIASNVRRKAVKKTVTRRIKDKHGVVLSDDRNGNTPGPGTGDDGRAVGESRSGGE